MIKINKIVIGILIAVIVLVVGYALFNESLSIKGSATTSGSMQFEFTDLSNGGDYYNDIDSVVSGNTITMTASLLKPGSTAFVMGKIKNTGTVDAVFDNISYTTTPNVNVCEIMGGLCEEGQTIMGYRDENTGIITFASFINSSGYAHLNKAKLTADEMDSNSVQFVIFSYWDESWETPITETQNVEFTATFNFVQAQ